MERKISDNECPVRKSMQIFAGKWTLLIIFQINRRIIRYGELKRAIPGISEKMLIDELKFLCSKGLVKKKHYPEVPPKVEYSLTPLGEKVLPIIDEIARFGMENL
ncbi:integrase [Porphyromonas crevioricanis]|uniref:HTH-type transcriptional activator hxlR n=2 Tax=Porphyromonas crevioricanis TaxID=393921 RepID=A0A0A2FMX1_9PORP|nr:helix-turn-helix domain-containing protein [Porphyromonas crevioricanis]KGN89654.1 integrase [Porphyromonas crevioricanis]KGN93792.1 integrase [Porphyromonas crevioricanis]SJZ78947.1 transcriptional regulator, HxlR family [Porphyromonas crevioricanis]SQH72416.1 HTH-type transcriptional activator hxlR [Porphyromonas crevioricanis]